MILDLFWLTEAQFAKIALHLPTDRRGRAGVAFEMEKSGQIAFSHEEQPKKVPFT